METKKEKAAKQLDKFIETCRKTIKLWVICVAIVALMLIIFLSITKGGGGGGENNSIWLLAGCIIAAFVVSITCFFYYFKIWFLIIEDNALVKRQKRILIFIALTDFFLGATIFIPLIAKIFFYLGYKELLKQQNQETANQ